MSNALERTEETKEKEEIIKKQNDEKINNVD